MRASRWIPLVLLVLAACGKRKEEAPGSQAEPGKAVELGLASLPAATRVVIGIAVPKIAASPLARRVLAEAMARDADIRPKIDALLLRCKLDLEKDVASVTIAMGAAEDVAVLARGRFDRASIVECVRGEAASSGDELREETFAGRVTYGVESPDRARQVWLSVDEGGLAVAATSQKWLQAVLDPQAEKLGAGGELHALLGRVDQGAAVWGVGLVPAATGQRLVEIAAGAIGQPARTVSFEVDAAAGLVVRLRLDMAAPADAAGLATFARRQMDLLASAAQRFGLGRVVSKTEITSDGASVKVALSLDDAELRQVEAALAGQTSEKKEQVR